MQKNIVIFLQMIRYLSYHISLTFAGVMMSLEYILLFIRFPYNTYVIALKTLVIIAIGILVQHNYIFYSILLDIVTDIFIWIFMYIRILIFFIRRLYYLQSSVDQLSHDIQNHLTVVNLSAQILNEEDDKDQNVKYLSMIEKNIQNIVNLMKGFNDQVMFKLPDFQNHDLVELIEKFIQQRRIVMSDHIYNIIYDNSNLKIYCDKESINRVIYNIIKNAEESTLAEGQSQKNIQIVIIDDYRYIKIMFIDNGKGVQAKDLKRIFKNSFTTKSYGSGLGMGIVQELVELHSGQVYMIPDIDHGRVVVRLKK